MRSAKEEARASPNMALRRREDGRPRTRSRGEVGVHHRLHARDQVVVAEALAVPICGSLKVPSLAPSSRAAAAAWASTSSLVAVELAMFAVGGSVYTDAGRARADAARWDRAEAQRPLASAGGHGLTGRCRGVLRDARLFGMRESGSRGGGGGGWGWQPGNIGCFFSLGCNFSKFFSMGQPLRFFLKIFKILVKGNTAVDLPAHPQRVAQVARRTLGIATLQQEACCLLWLCRPCLLFPWL